jgi:hypothetical protein
MTKSKLKALRRRIDEAGLQDRQRAILAAVSVLVYWMNHLDQKKAALRMLFHRKLEAWWSSPAPVDYIPFAIPDDRRASRLYLLAAIACITFETLLGAWISVTLGLPWWSGALVAVLAAVIFDGGFSLAFRQADRPKETLGKIKRWLLVPSLVGFGLSFLFLLLSRTVSGPIALSLLPIFSTALWTTTLSLLLMGGALFAATHIVDWSSKMSRDYHALDAEQANMKLLHDEFLNDLNPPTSSATGQSSPPADSSDSTPTQRSFALARVLPVLLLAGLLSVCVSCGKASPAPTVSDHGSVERELETYLDDSKSLSDDAGTVMRNLVAHLLEIAEAWNVTHLRFYRFGRDGWRAEERLKVDLPQLKLPTSHPAGSSELDDLGNIRRAKEARAAEDKAKAREKYREDVRRTLASVESDLLALSDPAEPPCTDINGVLRRIALASSAKPRLVILITDGVENCSSAIQPVARPEGDIRLVIILVPERPEEAKGSQRGYDQFAARSAQLSAAVPWAKVVPHFSEDLSHVFEQ